MDQELREIITSAGALIAQERCVQRRCDQFDAAVKLLLRLSNAPILLATHSCGPEDMAAALLDSMKAEGRA